MAKVSEVIELIAKGLAKNADEAAFILKTGPGRDLLKAIEQGEGLTYLRNNKTALGSLGTSEEFATAISRVDKKIVKFTEAIEADDFTRAYREISENSGTLTSSYYKAAIESVAKKSGKLHTATDELDTLAGRFEAPPPPPKPTTGTTTPPTATTGATPPPLPTSATPPVPASVAGASNDAAAAKKIADEAAGTTTKIADDLWNPAERALKRLERTIDNGMTGESKTARKSAGKADEALKKMDESLEKAEKAKSAGNADEAAKFAKEAEKSFDDASKYANKSSKEAAHFAKTKKEPTSLAWESTKWGMRLSLAGTGALVLDQLTGNAGSKMLANLANSENVVISTLAKPASWVFTKGLQTAGWLNNLGSDAIATAAITHLEINKKLDGEDTEKGKLQREIIHACADIGTGNIFEPLSMVTEGIDLEDVRTAAFNAQEAYDNCPSNNPNDQMAAAFDVINSQLVDKTLAARKIKEATNDTREITESAREKTEELAATVKKEASDLTGGFNLAAMMPDVDQNSFLFKIVGSIMSMVTTFIAAIQPFFTNPMPSFAKLKEGAENGNVVASKSNNPAHERIVFERDTLGPALTGPEFA